MKYKKLGRTDLSISEICLGTMTWGNQNVESEGHAQMDYALDQGINFFDTAELYAVPPSAETYGKTEQIIGSWFKNTGNRDKVILATKIAGGTPWIRDGAKIDRKNVTLAVEASLKRLQTDYIDIYQLHWPNRPHPHIGKHWGDILDYSNVNSEQEEENLLEILETVNGFVKDGKIRHFGLSDDTPWGMLKYIELAKKYDLPRVQSIQNEYSILHRFDEPYLTEVCSLEDVSYLPWSPLGGGMISGKYIDGARPEGSRWSLDHRKLHRDTEISNQAVKDYITLAKKHGLDVCQMALAFVRQQYFVTSVIIGATSMEQLKTDIASKDVVLSEEIIGEINSLWRKYPRPY